MKVIKLIVEKNKDGFWGQIEEHPEVFAQGTSIKELLENAKEGLVLLLEEAGSDIPEFTINIVLDLQEFFKVNDFIKISNLAKKAGMNQSLLRQYSTGIKYPSLKQVRKIERVVRELGREMMQTQITV